MISQKRLRNSQQIRIELEADNVLFHIELETEVTLPIRIALE